MKEKELKENIAEKKHIIIVEVDPANDIDYERCIARTKVTVDDVEYAAWYDTCNLVLRDKNGKCVELDEGIIADIESALDEYLDI